MGSLDEQAIPATPPAQKVKAAEQPVIVRQGWTSGASLIGAVLASTCCVLPLVLVTLGISGAWIGTLTALAPYKPYFIAATAVLLGAGFWQIYIRPKPACEEDSYCANPASGRITKGVLWLATFIVLLAISIDYWAPLFY